MSSLTRLKETLQEEAAAEIASIQADTKDKVAAIEDTARDKARKAETEIFASIDREIEELDRRTEAEATLMRRRIIMIAKAELADEAMRKAGDMLEKLPEGRYRAFMAKLLQEAVPAEGEVEVVLNARDRSRFGEDLLPELEAALRAQGYRSRLHMASDVGAMSGGFRLRGPDFEVDASLERLLADVSEQLEPEIAQVLFEEHR